MARLIIGDLSKIQKKTVTEAVPFEMRYPDEFKEYKERYHPIPPEAVFTTKVNPHLDYWDFTWTWYELEI